MKKLAVACLAAGAVLSSAPAAHAAPDPAGSLCAMDSLTDPQVEGSRTGEVSAWLLLTDDTDRARTYTGYVACTVQAGTNATHAGADGGVVRGNSGPGPLAVVAGTVTYEVGADENVYLCTEVVTNRGTVYWDAQTRRWSTNPNVGCELFSTQYEPEPMPDGIDPLVCPVFAEVFVPEGDIMFPDPIGKVWDCPPYDG